MILDDQLPTMIFIEHMLTRFSYIQLVHRANDVAEALKLLELQPVDMLFLDMEMPTMMGWEFANLLDPCPVIIVISSHEKFPYQAHKIGARGYLPKVPSFKLLKKTIVDAIREIDYIDKVNKSRSTFIKLREYKSKMETIIQYAEIRYGTIDDKELTLSLKDEKSFVTLLSLNALMDRLPSHKFIRISASQMVAIQEIKSYSKNKIKLKDGNDLLIIQKPEAYDAIDLILNDSKEDEF